MYDKLLIATILFIFGILLAWFSSYAQFFWEWAKDNRLLLTLICATPASLCFVYGVGHAYEFFHNGWGPRFYTFALSFIIIFLAILSSERKC